MDQELVHRLTTKATRTESGCLEWDGLVDADGYGRVTVRRLAKYRPLLAHRAMYIATHGEIAPGLCVCHSCDNRKCIEPSHLWLGTHAQNISDMAKKNRHPMSIAKAKGNRVSFGRTANAALSDECVRAIRSDFAAGFGISEVARRNGTNRGTAYKIRSGTAYVFVK